jgi:GNAT superfamily N-acetyltransferase
MYVSQDNESMRSLTISIEENPSEEDVELLIHKLVEFNDTKAEKENWQALAIFIRDENRHIIGGLNGHTHWNWLFIRHLWVEDLHRGKGYGRMLVTRAEKEALRRGCRSSWVDTFDFQAFSFYQKTGYEVFGILDDFPPGHKRYFLFKRILVPNLS